MEENESELARHDERIKTVVDKLEDIERQFEAYVLKVEYLILRNLVFGIVGLILAAVFGALISGVVHK